MENNFQNLTCSVEHCEGYHQSVEKMGYSNDITKNSVAPKLTKEKLIGEAARRPTATLKELQKYLENTAHYLYLTTVSCILQIVYAMAWLVGSPSSCKKKSPSLPK